MILVNLLMFIVFVLVTVVAYLERRVRRLEDQINDRNDNTIR